MNSSQTYVCNFHSSFSTQGSILPRHYTQTHTYTQNEKEEEARNYVLTERNPLSWFDFLGFPFSCGCKPLLSPILDIKKN